jgi:TonB-dependent starch-binding outer membrane protein SusC
LSLSIKNGSLESLFATIEQKTGFTVFYNAMDLKNSKPITIDVKDASVEEVLQLSLKGQALTYFVQEHTIFIKKKEVPKSLTVEPVTPGEGVPLGVSGVVQSDVGTPLAGATVFIRKLKKSATTDAKGEFLLKNVPDGEYEVEVSFVGYQTFTTTISVANHQAAVTAKLKQSTSQLDQTVVKGYYTTTDRLNTGDVTTVTGEEIEKQPVSDPILALEGRVPGLNIQQTSGVPGENSTIRIQGLNSIANGSSPLYIIDGVPYNSTSPTNSFLGGGALGVPSATTPAAGVTTGASPFNDLNPAEIESITILKDADATAIYGSRGANGVILITTKKGKAGHTQFDLNAFAGAGKVTRMLSLMNTPDYLEMRHEALNNDGISPSLNNGDFDLLFWDTTRYTNWQKVLIGNSAQFNNVQGNLSGGDANTQFLLGAGYSKQGTVYPGNYSDQKASVNMSLTHVSTDRRLHVLFTASYVNDNSNLPQVDLTRNITSAPDAPAPYDAYGNLNWQELNGSPTWNNPLSYTVQQAKMMTDNLISDLNVSYLILPGLQLKSNLGYNYSQTNQNLLSPATANPPPYNTAATRSNDFGTNDFKTWIFEPQINYEAKIAQGTLHTLLGSTFQQNVQNSIAYNTYNYSSDALIADPAAATTEQQPRI